MKQRTPITALLALAALLATGCDMTEDREACPQQGSVELSYDWANVPEGQEPPQGMKVVFYHEDGTQFPAETDNQGDHFSLPRGSYTLLVHNTDETVVSVLGENEGVQQSYIRVLPPDVPPVIPHPTQALAQGTPEQPYILQPTTLYSVVQLETDFFVEVGETVEKRVVPENHIRQALVEVVLRGDFPEVTGCFFELTSVVQALRMSDKSFGGDPATIAGNGVRTEVGYSRLFTLLGKHEEVPSELLLHIDCRSQTHFDFRVDVSEALRKINEEGTLSTTIRLVFDVTDRHDLGFVVDLVGWEHQEGGNLDVDFNE